MPARPGAVDHERGEMLHPSLKGDVVHLDAALRGQLLKMVVGQAKAQVPAHRQDVTSSGNR